MFNNRKNLGLSKWQSRMKIKPVEDNNQDINLRQLTICS
jgi:hypothetical protein